MNTYENMYQRIFLSTPVKFLKIDEFRKISKLNILFQFFLNF